MTPEERQLISGLFERMRPAANQQRDRDAETFINDQLRQQPYAPYLLSQTVIVQDQALRAAKERIEQLEAAQRQDPPAAQQDTSFLGGLGRSIFGAGQPDNRGSTVPTTTHAPGQGAPQDPGPWRAQQGYPQQAPAGGPWSQAAGAMGGMASGGGGGFLKGALGAAAGVAGGVLLADGIRNLFTGGNNPYGIASGLGGMGEGLGSPGGETIVNNYYDSPDQGAGGDTQNAGDFGGDTPDPGSYGGGGYSNDT